MSANADGSLPKRLGDFEILRQIGRGGMGIVYEARQRSLNRNVALKVLSSGLGLTGKAVMRFRHEAEAAAKLHHTNIVPIYATGEDHGFHFYAMELVEGPSLDKLIRKLRQRDADAVSNSAGKIGDEAPDSAEEPAGLRQTLAHESIDDPSFDAGRRELLKAVDALIPKLEGAADTLWFDAVARWLAEVADALQHAH